MQPSDMLTVSRRPLDVEDYIDIVRRHKAWILGPVFLGLVGAVVVAFLWPDTYVSTSLIRVVPPSVPEKFVPTNINQELSQRIDSMAQIILSRTALTNIIQTYNLYPRKQASLPMDDIVEQMRNDISISGVYTTTTSRAPNSRVSAFRISFAYENRVLAQRVTQELVTRFIDENIRQRSNASYQTTEFLQDQLETAKRNLDALEKKLTEFRLNNFGRLPDQFQANLQQLNAAERRIESINAAMTRINQEKLMLEGQLRILKDQESAAMKAVAQAPADKPNEALLRTEREISQVEVALASARERYKEAHPDVQRLVSQLEVLKRSRDRLLEEEKARAAEAATAAANSPAARELRELQAAVARVETMLRAKDAELEENTRELEQLRKVARVYQQKLETSPIGEQQYAELLRDRNLAKQAYEELNIKKTQSALATDLENRKQGEMLEILDEPSLPASPSEPNRYVIVAGGVGLGLVMGIFLAGAREMKDTSLKNLKDVRAYTRLTVLGSIPLLENDLVIRRRRRLAWLAWSTAFLIGVLVMSGSVYYYYATRS
jgi:Uncharacterized protein involved in exopolysaccharide biosynthesis